LIQDGTIMRKTSLIDPNLVDWADSEHTIHVSSTPNQKVQDLFTTKSSVEILRTYSDPTDITMNTESYASIKSNSDNSDMDISSKEEEEPKSSVTVPSSVSNFVIPWPHLKIGTKLGSGAFGDVKRGQWRDTPVAVKLLHSTDAATAFFQEASLLCSLRHPNVVACLGVCVEEPNLAIVMELMSGNLTQLITAGPIPLKSMVSLTIGIARGIAFLHQRSPKVIHRDIKPENILIDAGGAPKLGDFGVSKESLLTMTQTKIGTPSYAAPELLNSEAYGTAVDIYSMAMVMYSMATSVSPFGVLGNGAKPFTPLQVMMKVAIHRERPVIPASVHPTLAAIIRECWDHFPKKRPTASQLLQRLVDLEESLLNGSAQSSLATVVDSSTIPLTATVMIPSQYSSSSPSISEETKPLMEGSTTIPLHFAPVNGRVTRSATRSLKTNQTNALAGLSLQSSLLEDTETTQKGKRNQKKRKEPTKRNLSDIPYADEDDDEDSIARKKAVYQLEMEEGNNRRQWRFEKT
jgi:serine/threonine protein kinase